ncbi:branched-chain amino acid transport system II carrier protein [Alphaproteobacteria bacterium]|nr:branched-chain amino acid transport system II carrier protein [Alphaproteobacteria bacterium]
MHTKKTLFTYAFTLFAMFFGSGNLVFPIAIGVQTGQSWAFGFLGLFLTGIILPFLGLFVIKLYHGDYNRFFKMSGKTTGVILPLFILSLLGPFAVVPRCITVAHGGVARLSPDISLMLFSLLFCITMYIFCLKDKLVVKVLGRWMSPLLLGIILLMIAIGIYQGTGFDGPITSLAGFETGFLTGYQTMDLFAAFFFSSFIFKQLKETAPAGLSDKDLVRFALKPSLLGSLMLGTVYGGFVYLGGQYAGAIQGIPPEAMLAAIAQHLLGHYAAFFVAIVVILSCITTGIALNNIYAHYLVTLFKLDKKRFPLVLLGTSALSFGISQLDFVGISTFLTPILSATYPGLIVLTVFCLWHQHPSPLKKILFWSVTLTTILYESRGLWLSSFL